MRLQEIQQSAARPGGRVAAGFPCLNRTGGHPKPFGKHPLRQSGVVSDFFDVVSCVGGQRLDFKYNGTMN